MQPKRKVWRDVKAKEKPAILCGIAGLSRVLRGNLAVYYLIFSEAGSVFALLAGFVAG